MAASAPAHDAYLHGLYFYDRRDPIKSAEYFERAVELAPTYSSAYAGLADALTSEAVSRNLPADDVIDRARAAAKKAIDLDPQNGDAYIALGFLEQTLSWDWKAAETDLLHGIALSPSNSVGLMVYALRMEASGDTDTALSYMRRARDNDPLSYYIERQYTAVLFYARRYDDALEELRRTKEMYPDASDAVIDRWLSWTYQAKGMYDQAVEYDLRQGWRLNDADREALRVQYRQHGWRPYWQARLRKIPAGSVQGAEVYYLALICIRAGERDKAFAILDAAASHHCFWLEEASVDPMLDDLRGDPRFAALLRKLNLPDLHPNR
jgi:tetratricopeptide (TPR) repeat protein